MENLDLQQLEWLFYALLGLILLTVVSLILYVVAASRRRTRMVSMQQADRVPVVPPAPSYSDPLALVREAETGILMVETGGRRYRSLTDITEPEIRQEVLRAAVDLIRFTGVLSEEGLAPAPRERVANWREDMRAESRAWVESTRGAPVGAQRQAAAHVEPQDAEAQFLRSLTETGTDPASLAPPTLVGAIRRRMRGEKLDSVTQASFVDDIDRIVQRRVQMVPALSGCDLHMRLTSDHIVSFWFEGQAYGSLDQVPNLTAQQLLRDAIQEWEETT